MRVPGKVFLMGEYSVIQGGKAILAAIQPGMEYSLVTGELVHVHPEAPLGVYQNEIGKNLQLRHPQPVRGYGMGSSTADLIAGMTLNRNVRCDTEAIWRWYVDRFPGASGADLAVQNESMATSVGLFEAEKREILTPLPDFPLLSQLYLFQASASRKLPTHVALNQARDPVSVKEANAFVDRLRSALEENDERELGVLTEWAHWLMDRQRVTEFSSQVQAAVMGLPGILGVKGCGAGLHDLYLVAVGGKTSFSELNRLLAPALERFDLLPLGSVQELLWK